MSFIEFGPVCVCEPGSAMRIGYYDDDGIRDEDDILDGQGEERYGEMEAIVYFSEPPFFFSTQYEFVKYEHLRAVDTDSLWHRRDELQAKMSNITIDHQHGRKVPSFKKRYQLSLELAFVGGLLADRLIEAIGNEGHTGGKRLFISHSSLDKSMAISLAVDLANAGHFPWLDEWEIEAGESIPKKIARGIEECEFLLVLLSKNSVNSGWVEAEWSTKYWAEIQQGDVRVIPVLLVDCNIPTLLRTKKYADLRTDYSRGLAQINSALNAL